MALTDTIAPITGIEDPAQARVLLYQAGRPVHAPLDSVGLVTDTEMASAIDAAIDGMATAETRNRLVNPCFQHSQENGSTPGTVAGYSLADQWMMSKIHSAGTMTAERKSLADFTPNGGVYGARFTITAADASLAAGEYLMLYQPLETIQTFDFMWGYSTAKPVVVCFGFKGPAGTYALGLASKTDTRSYVRSFTITAGQADTLTTQVFAVPGDVTGGGTEYPSTGNQSAVLFYITLAAGSGLVGANGAWQAGPKYGVTGMSNGMGTAGAVFEITDVGLYLDPDNTGLAPPFQMPDEADELLACQRYYQVLHAGLRNDGYISGAFSVSGTFHTMRIAPSHSATWTTGTVNLANGPFISTAPNVFNATANPTITGNAVGILSAVKLNARM